MRAGLCRLQPPQDCTLAEPPGKLCWTCRARVMWQLLRQLSQPEKILPPLLPCAGHQPHLAQPQVSCWKLHEHLQRCLLSWLHVRNQLHGHQLGRCRLRALRRWQVQAQGKMGSCEH